MQVPIVIQAPDEKINLGEVDLQTITSTQRLARALKALAVCWILAVASVVIPIIHFVSVPLLFLAGPVVAYFFYRPNQLIAKGTGLCPSCQKPLVLENVSAEWPVKVFCTACRTDLNIRLKI